MRSTFSFPHPFSSGKLSAHIGSVTFLPLSIVSVGHSGLTWSSVSLWFRGAHCGLTDLNSPFCCWQGQEGVLHDLGWRFCSVVFSSCELLTFHSWLLVLDSLINPDHWEIAVLCWVDWVNTGPGVVATKEQKQGEDRDTAISYSEAKSPACEAIKQHTNGGQAEPWAGWVSVLQRHLPHSHHPEEVRILLGMLLNPVIVRHFSSYSLELGGAYLPIVLRLGSSHTWLLRLSEVRPCRQPISGSARIRSEAFPLCSPC